MFTTNLSDEYTHIAETFRLTQEQMQLLAYKAIEFIFEQQSMKAALKAYFIKWQSLQTPADL